jgi:predicted NBD/HSP70 family sugar kinase
VAFGLEIRPRALLGALIDLEGRALFTGRIALEDARPGHVLPLTVRMLEQGFAETGLTRDCLIGAGAVMPGPFGRTGLAGQGTDLPGWGGLDAADLLGRALDLPITVENDANAAAMVERISGVAQGMTSYAYLYFGTGLGLGVVSEGRVFRGAFGNAGEIGHIAVPTPDGPRPLEDLASRIALGRRMAAAGLPGDTVDDLERLHASDVPAYRAWREDALAALGHAVQVIENLFDPETIILGGAMPAPVLRDLAENTPLPQASVANRDDRALPRLMAGTAGRMTATIGAAALVVNTMLSPRLADTG